VSRVRVLVFPCGTEVGLEIAGALEHSVHVEIYGASSRDDHGEQAFPNYSSVPAITDGAFEDRFAALLVEWRIDLVFATHDSVHEYLAFRAHGWGIYLVNGNLEAAKIARRKSSTYAFFEDMPWVPRCYSDAKEVDCWPVVVKPDRGQGGQGVWCVSDPAALAAALSAVQEPVICEYLPGEELTVDCFVDRHGRLLHVGARTRERIVGGIAMRSRSMRPDAEVEAIAALVNARLRLRGPWFFQVRRDGFGRWKLLEISCRLSTGSTLQRAAGVNLPLLAVQDYLQRSLQVLAEPRMSLLERRLESLAVLDYDFDTCYIDLDDTLVCGGYANPQAMHFAYRLLQLDKSLVLLTRHPGDVAQTLASACIPESMFKSIVHLCNGEPKSTFIKGPALFVDNHFPERLEVSRRHGIPVFDVDAMALLFR
jgi:hypothetical protein